MSNTDQDFRIERDTMGELEVPANALWGAQTQRAVNNFAISPLTMPPAFIRALGLIKSSAASVNGRLGLIPSDTASAIVSAAAQVADGQHDTAFPVDVFQTGSGTSSNMNANEVIARLATMSSGLTIHPNDHVNHGQSSNDVIPTAIHVSAALTITRQLLPALDHLCQALFNQASRHETTVKTGRTHLMDAMPLSVAQEITAWGNQISQCRDRLTGTLPRLQQLAQGGTAVGTGVNAHPDFAPAFAEQISQLTGLAFTPSVDRFVSLASQDTAVEVSGALKTLAVALTKIANDLRWMNSGPIAGLAEASVPALQPGSSIMPGKINPVVPESVAMVCAQVMGNDTTISVAGASGNFQLNVMLPVIAFNLLQSIEILSTAAIALADQVICDLQINSEALADSVSRNPILVTALNARIGYEQGALIAKTAYQQQRPVIDVAAELTDIPITELETLLDPTALLAPR